MISSLRGRCPRPLDECALKHYFNKKLAYFTNYLAKKVFSNSLVFMYRLIRYIDENKLNLIYNDCSARNAILQSRGHNYLRLKSLTRDFKYNTWEEYKNSMGI